MIPLTIIDVTIIISIEHHILYINNFNSIDNFKGALLIISISINNN